MVLSTEQETRRKLEDSPLMATPEIEIQFDSSAMEYTVVASTSCDQIQSVTVIDAVRSKMEYGVWIAENVRQLARNQSRKADLRPLSPKRNRSSALEDHRNPCFMLERTNSFDNLHNNRISDLNNKIFDHRETLDSAARDLPPKDRMPMVPSSAPSSVLLLERKRSLPPRAPPPSHSFGSRMPQFFNRSVSFGGRNGKNDPIPLRRQISYSRSKST